MTVFFAPLTTRYRFFFLPALALFGHVSCAHAEDNVAPAGSDSIYRSAGNKPASSSAFGDIVQEGPSGGIWQQGQLLGDMGGLRSLLGSYGLSLGINETSEVLGNVTGGVKRGADYDGLTTLTLQMDTNRAFGWYGGTFNASALDVHGSNLSAHNLDTLQTSSGIEADDGFRLWELWYDQNFWYNQADVKIGQQSLDQEYMVSNYALLFVNTMFGWPMLPSADLLSGGPAYPLSSLGARIRLQPTGPWSLLLGVYDDNPSGINPQIGGDSQRLDKYGTNFRINDHALVITELQYSRPALGDLEYANNEVLPGTYKLGAWYDFGKFADQDHGTDGLSLATGNGIPALHSGNYSVYGVIDQQLWRESPQDEEGVGFFFRAFGAPDDRNLVNFSLNAGFTYREPFEHREDDVVGLGMGYANVSASDRELDASSSLPVKRSGETFVEVTYQYALAPWWSLQPDVQYVFNPGAGITNSNEPTSTKRLGNETVIGLRTSINF